MYNEALANVERLSKPREKLTALERTFGRNSFTNWVSDFTTRAIDQGLAQGATIRENLNLAINANDVTDEELDDFRRAVLAAAEAGPSDEMQEFGRRVEEKTKGMSYGGKLLTTIWSLIIWYVESLIRICPVRDSSSNLCATFTVSPIMV